MWMKVEEREHLVEHVLEELEHVVTDTQHVLLDPPERLDVVLLSGVAELGIGGDRRERVSGHLDLRHDRHMPVGGIPHDLSHVVLGVEARMRDAGESALLWIGRARREHAVPARRADPGELRVPPDLDPPALVIGEMPVEDVQLVQSEEVDVLEHGLPRHEVPADVQVAAAPIKTRRVLDLDGGDVPARSLDARATEDRDR
jgi:hypothetical protein